MNVTFLRSKFPQKLTNEEILSQLKDKTIFPKDNLISKLRAHELNFSQITQALKSLSSYSIRGKTVNKSFVLNKPLWENTIEELLKQSSLHKPEESEFKDLCTSLSHLRYENLHYLKSIPRRKNDILHFTRYIAEINGNIEEVNLQQVLMEICNNNQPPWVAPHLCISLAMLLKDNKNLKESQATLIHEINTWIWKTSNEKWNKLNSLDILDLTRSRTILNPNELISKELLNLIENQTSLVDQSIIKTSYFQKEVMEILLRLNVPFQKELPDGVDIGIFFNNKKIALQCYGPTHFLWKDGSKIEGRTAYQEYLLQLKNDYDKIVAINYVDWLSAGSSVNRRKILEKLVHD